MSAKCDRAIVIDGRASEMDDSLDMEHIAACPHCTKILQGHRKLAHVFEGTARHSVSIHFNRELRNRLLDEQQCERQVRLRALAMRSYWLVATVASACILWLLPWSSQALSTSVIVSFGAFAGLAAIVPAMIVRNLRDDCSLTRAA